MKYTKKQKEFIDHVKKVAKIYNLKFCLKKTKYLVADNLKCAGWFDENEALVVAMNNNEWLEILVHEYSHLTQYIENNDIWKRGAESTIFMNEWLNGKKIRNINKHLDNVKFLELDNEKRAVKNIIDFGLNINVDNYIKRANAYVLFHNWLKTTRKWPNPSNSPYKNKRIIAEMSNKFDMNYNKLSKKLIQIFDEENI